MRLVVVVFLFACALPLAGCGSDERCSAACDRLKQCGESCVDIQTCDEFIGQTGGADGSDYEEITECIADTECSAIYRTCLFCRDDSDCAAGDLCQGAGADAVCRPPDTQAGRE
jgi:hypothetical protein